MGVFSWERETLGNIVVGKGDSGEYCSGKMGEGQHCSGKIDEGYVYEAELIAYFAVLFTAPLGPFDC